MKPYPKVQNLGYQAYKIGVPKEKNPFQYHSLKNQGPQKAAAWLTGWNEAKKRSEAGH